MAHILDLQFDFVPVNDIVPVFHNGGFTSFIDTLIPNAVESAASASSPPIPPTTTDLEDIDLKDIQQGAKVVRKEIVEAKKFLDKAKDHADGAQQVAEFLDGAFDTAWPGRGPKTTAAKISNAFKSVAKLAGPIGVAVEVFSATLSILGLFGVVDEKPDPMEEMAKKIEEGFKKTQSMITAMSSKMDKNHEEVMGAIKALPNAIEFVVTKIMIDRDMDTLRSMVSPESQESNFNKGKVSTVLDDILKVVITNLFPFAENRPDNWVHQNLRKIQSKHMWGKAKLNDPELFSHDITAFVSELENLFVFFGEALAHAAQLTASFLTHGTASAVHRSKTEMHRVNWGCQLLAKARGHWKAILLSPSFKNMLTQIAQASVPDEGILQIRSSGGWGVPTGWGVTVYKGTTRPITHGYARIKIWPWSITKTGKTIERDGRTLDTYFIQSYMHTASGKWCSGIDYDLIENGSVDSPQGAYLTVAGSRDEDSAWITVVDEMKRTPAELHWTIQPDQNRGPGHFTIRSCHPDAYGWVFTSWWWNKHKCADSRLSSYPAVHKDPKWNVGWTFVKSSPKVIFIEDNVYLDKDIPNPKWKKPAPKKDIYGGRNMGDISNNWHGKPL